MGRKAGSGKYGRVTANIERLAAEVFAHQVLPATVVELSASLTARRSALDARSLLDSFSEIARQAGLAVATASAPDPDRIADIRLDLQDGSIARIKVKAQTTQGRNSLRSADWTHDATDTLRWLYTHDEDFRRRIPEWLQGRLHVADPRELFDGWDLGSLWACDVARLRDGSRRCRAGVRTKSDLREFLSRFYLLHVTGVGSRLIPFGNADAIGTAVDSGRLDYEVSETGKSSAIVTVSPGSRGFAGQAGFIYYVGYPSGVIGRHKLHEWVVDGVPGTIEVQHR